jgi:hypothetical protein
MQLMVEPLLGCSLTGGGVSDSRPQFRFTQAVPQTPVESALNATRSFYLGPNADVYLYSTADGELIARIQNLSSHDYGCTSIELVRAGAGISQFWNNNIPNYLMNKAFRVTPTNNNPSGQYYNYALFIIDGSNRMANSNRPIMGEYPIDQNTKPDQ